MSNCVGAISQLVAQGHLNKYLNHNPSITFWRYQHLRHTNFALENQLLTFDGGGSNIGANKKTSVRLHRSGDLVYFLYALIDLPGVANVTTTTTEAYNNTIPATGAYAEICQDATEAQLYKNLGTGNGSAASQAGATQTGGDGIAHPGVGVPYWTNAVGQYLVKECSVFIGSQPIDTLYNDYLFAWEELTGKPGRRLLEMIGKQQTIQLAQMRSKFFRRLYVPLPFFFTKTSGNALPLVSLQFHDVKVQVTWAGVNTAICNSSGIGGSSSVTLSDNGAQPGVGTQLAVVTEVRKGQAVLNDPAFQHGALSRRGTNAANYDVSAPVGITDQDVSVQLEACYVYLDVMERAKFAEGSFEMLMDEVQALGKLTAGNSNGSAFKVNLNFNHAIIELIWAARQKLAENACAWFDYAGLTEPLTGAKLDAINLVDLRLNNQCRFNPSEGRYFRLVQPYQHHTNIPECFIYSYSFALHPEDAQASGSCNFSRIDNAEFNFTIDQYLFEDNSVQGGLNLSATQVAPGAAVSVTGGNSLTFIIYARNWNILRVTLGLAGKAYAN